MIFLSQRIYHIEKNALSTIQSIQSLSLESIWLVRSFFSGLLFLVPLLLSLRSTHSLLFVWGWLYADEARGWLESVSRDTPPTTSLLAGLVSSRQTSNLTAIQRRSGRCRRVLELHTDLLAVPFTHSEEILGDQSPILRQIGRFVGDRQKWSAAPKSSQMSGSVYEA